ncbi:hypothetical protein SAY86_015269 [Trapa natans]|uniref:VQ domain-containing protein n=1 Tax=Trapa natans TaxID=22666 RepID=A0AAN7KLR7_TRANT|nr:hypothetical protein SAY86_015269 [Trapa natans]
MAMDDPSGAPSALTMHRDSLSISKSKPRVRVVHVIDPEIIKTDVENFRDLVQQLTGKHSGNHQKPLNRTRRPEMLRKGPRMYHNVQKLPGPTSPELGMWNNAESSGGFLNGFEHLDRYVQEPPEFPLLPMDHHRQASINPSSSSQSSTRHTSVL